MTPIGPIVASLTVETKLDICSSALSFNDRYGAVRFEMFRILHKKLAFNILPGASTTNCWINYLLKAATYDEINKK